MKVILATLCLNEMEWLPRLYQQHKDWPGLVKWVFVESADRMYALTNPFMVTEKGLSIDGTSDYLHILGQNHPLIQYIPCGISAHTDPAQGKCESRNYYLEVADELQPDIVVVLDADEFYTLKDQQRINRVAEHYKRDSCKGLCFKQRHIWHPQAIEDTPLFQYEVTGAYWNIPHVRVWLWKKGMRYTNNHNTPICPGLCGTLRRLDATEGMPECVHMGFASSYLSRKAKHRYYIARGEGIVDRRQMYVDCRDAFETWEPCRELPHGAKVAPYTGDIPEVFRA